MDTATFHFTDPRSVVDAELACPRCLHTVSWEPVGAGVQPAVECRCETCGHHRTVELNGSQMLRLTIADGEDDYDGFMADRSSGATWRQVLQRL